MRAGIGGCGSEDCFRTTRTSGKRRVTMERKVSTIKGNVWKPLLRLRGAARVLHMLLLSQRAIHFR